MNTILIIILIVCLFSVSFLGYGSLFNKENGLCKKYLYGLVLFYAICQVMTMILVAMAISTTILFNLFYMVIIIGIVCFLFKIKSIVILSKPSKTSIYLFIGFVLFMVVAISTSHNKTIGIVNFDSSYYLSMVNANAFKDVIGFMNYTTREVTNNVSAVYDYSGYYHVWSSVLKIVHELFEGLISNVYSHYFIGGSSIIYYIASYCLAVITWKTLKIKNIWVTLLYFLLVLGFFGSIYYNSSLAFFGNTYRRLITAFIILQMYELIKYNSSLYNYIKIAISCLALVTFSSSGFFISAVIVYCLIAQAIINQEDNLGYKIIVTSLPVGLFALLYISSTSPEVVYFLASVISILYIFCLFYETVIKEKYRGVIRKLSKILVLIIPIIIAFVSVFYLSDYYAMFANFFENHARYDMIWEIKDFATFETFVINGLLLIGIVSFLITKKQGKFRYFYFLFLVTFFNPISYVFLYKFMASQVWYRVNDILINPFTFGVYIVAIASIINNKRIKNGIFIILIGCISILSYDKVTGVYHEFSEPSADYNKLYKTESEKLEVFEFINNKSQTEDLTLISQIKEVGAFTYNTVDRMRTSKDDDMKQIFMYREFADDFPVDLLIKRNVCEILIEEKADFVIIDKNQAYRVKENEYHLVTWLVRDCGGENVFNNNIYDIYEFYWEGS